MHGVQRCNFPLTNIVQEAPCFVPGFAEESGDRPAGRRADGEGEVRLGGRGHGLDRAEVPQQRPRLGLAQPGYRQQRLDHLEWKNSWQHGKCVFDLTSVGPSWSFY